MRTTVYTVKKGDTLSSIAKRFGTEVSVVAGFNGIADPDRISEGQIIRIPLSEPRDEEYMSYTVQKGDTLYSLSRMFNTDVSVLSRLNGIPDPDYIEAGRTIRIPITRAPESIRIYIAADGDTLYDIGRRYGYETEELAAYNDITDPDKLNIGQVIRFPSARGGECRDGIYTAKPGDTLWKIGESFGVSVAELINMNMLTEPDRIAPGQQIRVRSIQK